MIKILARDITSKGLEIDQTIPKEGIGLSDEEIDLHSPITVKAHLERVGNVVNATAHVKADFGYLCARCLEDMHAEHQYDYDFHFDVESADDYIDLGEEIRQELIMANPARVLCKPDCKGICADCGANLNEEPCKCSSGKKKK